MVRVARAALFLAVDLPLGFHFGWGVLTWFAFAYELGRTATAEGPPARSSAAR